MLIVVGIDPGVRPVMARISEDGAVDFEENTAVIVKRGKGKRTVPQPALIANILRRWRPDIVVVEAVQPIGRPEGKTRSPLTGGWLMHARGVAEGCCAGVGIPCELVAPSTWTQAMKVRGGPEAARQRALELNPLLAQALRTKSSHNRAAAYLLARWALLTLAPKHPLF